MEEVKGSNPFRPTKTFRRHTGVAPVYNSRIGYFQDGVQVIRGRVIYPDGSSVSALAEVESQLPVRPLVDLQPGYLDVQASEELVPPPRSTKDLEQLKNERSEEWLGAA